MRRARGAIDFDLPEYKVILDERGMPVRLERRPRQPSHRLIEECMLAANEAVAQFFRERELPSVYRFHGAPDEEKLETFAALARAHGFDLGARGEITAHQLNRFLEALEGHPERRALNQLLLRSMMQAVYSAENVGHYGLGAEHYLHFTSPIRRYPDLLVHRLLKEHWARSGRVPPPPEREVQEDRLEELAVQSSERERAAVAAEREVVSFYSTLLMKERVGEEFSATVSSLADFGFFIELDDLHVEGLVKAETLGSGYRFDPQTYALTWPTGRRIKVGDQLRARLISANVARRQLDFAAIAFGDEQALPALPAGGEPPPPEDARTGGQRFEHPDRDSILRGAAKRGGRGGDRRDVERGAGPRSTAGSKRSGGGRPSASGAGGRRGGGEKQGQRRGGSSRTTPSKRRR
jgi:ribonuclease R